MYGSERVNARISSRYIRTAMSVGVLFYWFIFYKQMHPIFILFDSWRVFMM